MFSSIESSAFDEGKGFNNFQKVWTSLRWFLDVFEKFAVAPPYNRVGQLLSGNARPYFIILLCLRADDFTCQMESAVG
jgi:hypothetical protein